MGVHIAAQDRMAQLTHMNTQLMRASGDRFQQHTGAVLFALEHLEAGEGGFATLVTDHLPRSVIPVAGDGQSHFPFILFHDTEDNCVIGLFHLALLELSTDMGMRGFVKGNHHNARGVQIQPVDNTCRGVALLQS